MVYGFDFQRRSVAGRYHSYVMIYHGLVALSFLIYDADVILFHYTSDSDQQPTEKETIQLQSIKMFWNPINAYIYQEKLLANGINNAKIQDDHLISIEWLYVKAIVEIKLEVLKEDVDRSLKLILESVEVEEGQDAESCPNCRFIITFLNISWFS